jgi:hypothetical protein
MRSTHHEESDEARSEVSPEGLRRPGGPVKYLLAFVFLCVSIGWAIHAINSAPGSGPGTSDGERAAAELALQQQFGAPCQLAIQKRLRDPESAVFDYPAVITKGAKGHAVVESFHAKNGFGGTNPGKAICRFADDGKPFTVELLTK